MARLEVVYEPQELQNRLLDLKKQGKRIGLVPTMGALHYGHLSLAITSKNECDVTVVSDFVNPTQFAPGEDFDKYPRTLDNDIELLTHIGVDFVFAPSAAAMYPRGFKANVHVGGVSEVLEGSFRPTHFDGVCTVVLKLFNISGADVAYFGQKDFQQVAVVKKMVSDLNLSTEIVSCPIIREKDGLAMSSRNKYLSPTERENATVLYRSLETAREIIESGVRDAKQVRETVRQMIEAVPDTKIDYICIADPDTLGEMSSIAGNVVILLAVRFGSTRLIDNIVVPPGKQSV
ncbi:MAG: pantoate--beta-alanine ligase [Thermoguttaceae bacterium]|nr:pantoate--beta-alanine ligase [Thermoguttaceae bacterium]